MSTIRRFEDMELWKKARKLENQVFSLTDSTKYKNDFDLIRQMRRASGKLMDNIAEGFGRDSNFEFIQFLSIVKGSAAELQSQLYRSKDRQYISQLEFDENHSLIDEILKMTTSLIIYLNKSDVKGLKFKDRNKN